MSADGTYKMTRLDLTVRGGEFGVGLTPVGADIMLVTETYARGNVKDFAVIHCTRDELKALRDKITLRLQLDLC
jgi:hypothetical protein